MKRTIKKQGPEELEEKVAKLEEKVAAAPKVDFAIQQSVYGLFALPTLEDYITTFSLRYEREETFQEMVHKYLSLRRGRKLKLALGKMFGTQWYKEQTSQLVKEYAVKIRDESEKAVDVRRELEELERTTRELEEGADIIVKTEEEKDQAGAQLVQVKQEADGAVQRLESAYEEKKQEEEVRVQIRKGELAQQADVGQMIAARLKRQVAKSSLVKVDEEGRLSFDEELIMRRLEDLMLDEVIEGIEKEGTTGFLSKMVQSYTGVISKWDQIEDLGELPNVDWTQSIIYARTKGYKVPVFPYMIVGKAAERARGQIDTALTVDTSGSMGRENIHRFQVAGKMALSVHGLMRKLNPSNAVFFSHYNNALFPTTMKEFMRSVVPDGYTRTDLALEWLLQTLIPRGPSLAYLVTDGAPYGGERMDTETTVRRCLEVAGKFQQHPYIKLRIFLIDGNRETEEIIRQIGRAAGSETKILPVKNYQLAGGVIKDISQAIGEMYEVGRF